MHIAAKFYITVEDAMAKWGCTRSTVIKMFKDLADSGVGQFKQGRKGWPTRLER